MGTFTIPNNIRETARRFGTFLVVGGLAFIVDAAIFNSLVYWGGAGPLNDTPLIAKAIAILAATLASYLGSKFWTFSDSNSPTNLKQFLLFILLNIFAMFLQLGCLWFSRYILHLSSPLSDNVSGTVIGQAFATFFRYATYRRWVFPIEGSK